MEFARVVSSIAFVNGEVFLTCVVKHRCEGMCPGKAPIEVCISLGDERVVFSTGKVVAIESWNKTSLNA